jgi:hypothetical protein
LASEKVSELDRWRVAQQIINSHGAGAEAECGRRAAEFVKQGDLEGFYLWQNIALKVNELQRAEPNSLNSPT